MVKLLQQLRQICRQFNSAERKPRYVYCLAKYVFFARIGGWPVQIPLRPDLVIETNGSSASAGCAVLYDLFYEPRVMYFLQDWLRCDDDFVDIGANVGVFSLLARRKISRGRILAVEASPRVFQKLRRNIEINCARNVTAINVAVHDRPGFVWLNVADGDCEGHIVAGNKAPEGVRVTADTLANILRQNKLSSASIIKMDVEGGELPIVLSSSDLLRSENPPVVLVDYYRRELAAAFRALDYKAYRYCRDAKFLEEISGDPDEDHGAVFVRRDRFEAVAGRFR